MNDAALLENSELNINDVTSKIKHWENIEMYYLSGKTRPVSRRFLCLEINLIKLYMAILEFEVEVFHWYNHGVSGMNLNTNTF
jgi:hypothetical protein